MTDSTIARRYAQALFLIGEENGKTDAYLSQLNMVKEAFAQTPELLSVFKSQLVSGEKKKALLAQIFSQDVEQNVQNFLFIIVDKGREAFIEDIIAEYQNLTDEKNNIVCVKVETAAELTEEQLAALKESVKAKTGKNARIETELNESLIGGMKIKIGDFIYDASVTGQLSALKQQLLR